MWTLQIHVYLVKYLFPDHNLAFFLNMLFPDSQNWIVFQPNIIIDAKLGKYYFCSIGASAEMSLVCTGNISSLLHHLLLQIHFLTMRLRVKQ